MAKQEGTKFKGIFVDETATSEEAFLKGAGTGTVAIPAVEAKPEDTKAIEDQKKAEQRENDRSDPLKHVPRVGESIQLEENKLPNNKRQRKQHGTNLTIPLYFEELKVIQEAMEKEGESDSINDFIRTQVLAKAESILGEKAFNKIVDYKRNKVKEDKKDKTE
ncbi:hypothetical protein R7J20_16780 [Acinetobacter baumannii]|nr:hypothetical protein [Acinetobacter baumannii]MDW5349532.1 hypothetical protein [Acinetobacter baumannii]MDW5367042.1 hypothetical protein [Acinetobacter baumannii]MDW5382293.1 hypothetical protein [Acinetobacter baumannii]